MYKFLLFWAFPMLIWAQKPILPLNQVQQGTLSPSDSKRSSQSYFDTYQFEGKKGDKITITLSSSILDPYLMMTLPNGKQLEKDDISPQNSTAEITTILEENGVVYVTATTYHPNQLGAYTILLQKAATEPTPIAQTASEAPADRRNRTRNRQREPRPNAANQPTSKPIPNTPSNVPAGQPPRIYGLFIGISDYGQRAPSLNFTANDAHIVRNSMIDLGMRPQDGIVLTDANATAAEFQRAINALANEMTSQDMFVFFFSGHGDRKFRTVRQSAEPDGYDETLEMYDESVLDDELDVLLGGIRAKTQIIVVDACFSGGLAKDIITRPNRMGLFSSDEDLESNVAAQFKAGGFLSKFFSEGVKSRKADLDRDGSITALELSQYVYERYRDEVRDPKNRDGSVNRVYSYQRLVVDRGGIRPETVLFR